MTHYALFFPLLLLTLAVVVFAVYRMFFFSSKVTIHIAGKELTTVSGRKLLEVLVAEGWPVPSSCGGAGKCGQCRCVVTSKAGRLTRAERRWIDPADVAEGMRLSCQVKVRAGMEVTLLQQVLDAQKLVCRVASIKNLSPFIKELILEIPEASSFTHRPGASVMVEIPPHSLAYKDMKIDNRFHNVWAAFGMERYRSRVPYPVSCPYSIVGLSAEQGLICLNVRVLQPADRHDGAAKDADKPVFVCQPSAYLFNLQPGDLVTLSGPFGTFCIDDNDMNREIALIGGGTGLAPLYSHLQYLLASGVSSPISLWYGSRNAADQIYLEELQQLQASHDNFSCHPVLSNPFPEENWNGPTGYLQDTLEQYLQAHPAPDTIACYLCGPISMVAAVYDLLQEFGVDDSDIHLDEDAISRHMLKTQNLDGLTGATTLY